MRSYYFTFGCGTEHPFKGGWIIVKAKNKANAKKTFSLYFPDKSESGENNYAMMYSEDEFKCTQMYENGNHGKRCHGIIEFKQLKQKAV